MYQCTTIHTSYYLNTANTLICKISALKGHRTLFSLVIERSLTITSTNMLIFYFRINIHIVKPWVQHNYPF